MELINIELNSPELKVTRTVNITGGMIIVRIDVLCKHFVFAEHRFGQRRPPLTELIRNILERYPDGGQILKVTWAERKDFHVQINII